MAANTGGWKAYLGYAWETGYATAGSPINKVFGQGQRITTTTRNNTEKVFGLGNRNAATMVAKKFEGTLSIESVLANGWWIRGMLGSPATAVWTGSPMQWWTYTFLENTTIPSFTVENGVDMDTDVARTLKGAVMSNVTISAAVNELVKLRFECPYSNETKGTTLIAAGTQPTDGNEPFAFQNGTISIAGSTMAEIQNVELNVNNNAEPTWGCGSRWATNAPAKNREYGLRMTATFKDVTEFLNRTTGGAGSPAMNPADETTAFLKFDNGGSGTAQRIIQINLGSVFFDEHTLPQDATETMKEDVVAFATYCGSVTYIAGSQTVL
jgi:hypothetical protein